MKKLFLFLFLLPMLCGAATVQFGWTNFDATISTNDLVITMINAPINDGTYTIKGLPRRYTTTNGFLSATILTGNYSVAPYGVNIQPVLFAVPNDSQTYDYWLLRISGGNTYNYSPGVQQLVAGSGTSLSPSNGKGIVTVTSTGSGGIGAVAAGGNVNVATNSNLYTVSLPFTPQIASSTLSNYSTVGTNYWYPTNNPQGFISSNNVPTILGYITNSFTTNTSIGNTNIVNNIIALTPVGNLSNVKITAPVNGNTLTYLNGNWTNQYIGGTATSIGLTTPTEFTVSGSPVTTSGTLNFSKANQNANLIYAGPTTGGAAAPTFRALVAADIPAVSSTVYASNIVSGGNIPQLSLASNANANGWVLVSTNGFNFWSINAGALTNLQSLNLVGLVPTANEGTGTPTSGKFLRGDQLWTNTLTGPLTLVNGGNFTNTGNISSDNGAILTDGSGNLTALKFIGQHYGQGVGLTNIAATNLIGVLPDARISNNIPRLEAVNTFTGNDFFSGSVVFSGSVRSSGTASVAFGGPVEVGTTLSLGVISSNTFQVVNPDLRYEFEVQTNGTVWIGTNHQFTINFNGGVESYSGTNYFGGTIVNSNTFTGNKVISYEFDGNGSGITNITIPLDANQFSTTLVSGDSGPRLHFISAGNVTNLTAWGQTSIAPSGQLYINGYVLSNNVATSELTLVNGLSGPPMETMNGSTLVHKFFGPVVSVATTNNFAGVVKAASFSGVHTNTASSGSKVQVADANGKIVDDSNGAVPIDGDGTAATSTQIQALFPGNILTNGESVSATFSNTVVFNDAANNKASITNGVFVGTVSAATITNRASAGGKLAAYDANGKLIDVSTITGGSFSGTTLTVSGAAGVDATAWHQSGDNSGSIIGNTNSGSLQIRGAIPAGGASVTFMDFEATSTPGINIYGGLTNGCISATTFQSLVFGGQHNTINVASTTADSIVGGQFNFIDAGGGGNFGASIFGGASNHVAGTCSYAMGQAAQAINDNAFRWNGIANKIYTSSGSGADNGTVGFAFVNYFDMTNSATGRTRFSGNAADSTNTVELNASTFGWTNAAGNFGLLWLGTNGPSAQKDNKIINGSLGGSNSVVLGTQTKPGAFQIKTNGDVRIEGSLVVLGSTTTSGAGLTAASVPYSALAVQTATNLASHFADVGNSGTSDTTLYSDSIPASTLGANGNVIRARYGLNTVLHATATRQIKLFFAGTSILDTGAVIYSANGSVDVDAEIIRDSSTSIRYTVSAKAYGTSGTISTNYISVGKLTGLTLSGANNLDLHGQAAAVGAASNDIVATMAKVNYEP